MPALKFVMKQSSFFGLMGTIQNLFASNFMPNGSTPVLVVNPAKTLLEWTSNLNTFMTATGTGLKVNGGDLLKGTIVDVEYTGSSFSPSVMQMFGLNTNASKVQQTIDDILIEQAYQW